MGIALVRSVDRTGSELGGSSVIPEMTEGEWASELGSYVLRSELERYERVAAGPMMLVSEEGSVFGKVVDTVTVSDARGGRTLLVAGERKLLEGSSGRTDWVFVLDRCSFDAESVWVSPDADGVFVTATSLVSDFLGRLFDVAGRAVRGRVLGEESSYVLCCASDVVDSEGRRRGVVGVLRTDSTEFTVLERSRALVGVAVGRGVVLSSTGPLETWALERSW